MPQSLPIPHDMRALFARAPLLTRGLNAALTGAVILTTTFSAYAQTPAKTARLRGDITAVSPNGITVHRNSGDTVTVDVPPDVRIGAVKKMSLADIKPGSFIGTAAMTGVDGKMTATEVHVFDESARGTGEGHRPYDLGPQSTMTNANVDSVVKSKNGNTLELSYKGGTNTITVPANVPVVGFINATREDLQPGKKVVVTATAASDGHYSAQRILVEKNGVPPPM
ncbi:hypothetical protein JOE11_002192 [Robbsia andropogonis]|nr:hypothetical protein [Robbsia andropogonis]MCP1117321.1 hypothetical protein [Robbsia andropogonis]MCP1129284.1 hypothetical protein [Robbsia andropogonis]